MPSLPRFLCPETFAVGGKYSLSDEESTHALRVLRLTIGDSVILMNGRGQTAEGKITGASKKSVEIEISKIENQTTRSRVQLAFALPKATALEILLRKCTEIGIDHFQPLITEHAQRYDSWNEERWQRIIAEATKQCQDPQMPTCDKPHALREWLPQYRGTLIFCDEANRAQKITLPSGVDPVTILIGAEGGWSEAERELVENSRGWALGLGRNRLRAETAAIVAVTLVKQQIGEI